ncbi:MAG: hypothetical protein AAF371_08195 [Pseudomonadota bacterium]
MASLPFRALAALALSISPGAAAFELSIDVTQPAGEPYETAIALIRDAGAGATSLSLFWDDLERIEGRYSPEIDWPALANAYYPSAGLSLTLTFSVIDTATDRRPARFRQSRWDDPEMIAAFASHIDDVMSRLSDTDVLSVSIGNEVDGFLASEKEIAAFAQFLDAARRRVERWRPGVSIGTKLTYSGFRADAPRWQPLLARSSGVHVTYYPLDEGFRVRPGLDVAADLGHIRHLSGERPVFILEAGYPSEGCGAESAGQTAFVQALLGAASARDSGVSLVSLTWLTDLTDAEVEQYRRYYGVGDDCFARFLASIGLRSQDGDAKPALRWLLERM